MKDEKVYKAPCLHCQYLREVKGPNEPGPNRPLQQYCYYCTHQKFPHYRKIASKVDYTGRLPGFCPIKDQIEAQPYEHTAAD